MGISTGAAILISSVIGAGSAVASSMMNKPDKAKSVVDARKATLKDVNRKGARAALISGQPAGITGNTVTGRGALLGN